jgi:hypothetical protein
MNGAAANQTGLPVTGWRWFALSVWLLFFGTFPAGMMAGWLLAQGQDAAGRGIGIGLGMLGVGLLGGMGVAVLVSYATARIIPSIKGKLLACLPWVILVGFWGVFLFTASGDRLFEWLESV